MAWSEKTKNNNNSSNKEIISLYSNNDERVYPVTFTEPTVTPSSVTINLSVEEINDPCTRRPGWMALK